MDNYKAVKFENRNRDGQYSPYAKLAAMERKVFQTGFDDQFKAAPSQEVATVVDTIRPVATPEQSLYAPVAGGRFVRELAEADRFTILEPKLAGRYFLEHIFTPFADFEQEELWALMVNNRNLLTHTALIYRGSVNSISVRMAEIFRAPVRVNATAIILGHNHPSGETNPSQEDVKITRSVSEAGNILGVELLDHLIIGADSWVSLKERGLGFD